MGFDPITIAIAATVISTGLQVVSGIEQYQQQKKADKAARNAANSQAALVESDAAQQAQQEQSLADTTRKSQLMAYLSSGVTLEGSPLLVMADTKAKGDQNAKNITDSAHAKADLLRQQGSVGRASLLGTAAGAASDITTGFANYATINKNMSSSIPSQIK